MTATLHSLPSTGLAPSTPEIARLLRKLADDLEAEGQAGKDTDTVVLMIEPSAGQMTWCVYGKPLDNARLVGLIEYGKARIIARSLGLQGD